MLALLIRVVLSVVFAVAGIAKLLDRAGTFNSLREFGVPRTLAGALSVALPVVELATAVALLTSSWAWPGAIGIAGMLLIFTAAIAVSLARGRRSSCHCFGQMYAGKVGPTTVVRNLALLSAALFIVWLGPGNSGPGVIAGAQSAPLWAWLATTGLWGLVLIGVAIVQLLKQNGRLLLRVEAMEKQLGITAAEVEPAGLPVGQKAPDFWLPSLNGGPVSLSSLLLRGKPVMLFFIEPGCGPCHALLPEIGGWHRDHADRFTLAVISRPDISTNAASTNEDAVLNHLSGSVLLQGEREVAEAYQVSGTPAAVLIRDGAIATSLRAGGDSIRELVASVTLPRTSQHDPVPSNWRLSQAR